MKREIERFLEIFYEISKIPRQSGKEDKIADFIEKFANQNNLEVYRDQYNNILIKKKGNLKSKCNEETIILQAHTDMVCVKTQDSHHDFDKDPIQIVIDEDRITAKDTTLGGDQGIGLAFMLLILESNEIRHPNLECLFTTEEETTFNGAVRFDYTKLNGKKLINIDHCEDDTIIIGSDGDIANQYIMKGESTDNFTTSYQIEISNLHGGSYGTELENERINAIKLMASILKNMQKYGEIYINTIDGGEQEGDIPSFCKCIFSTEIENVKEKIANYISQIDLNHENPKIELKKVTSNLRFSKQDTQNVINQIFDLKQGIITRVNGDVLTSGNIGVISTSNNEITIKLILKSLEVKELDRYQLENKKISEKNNFKVQELYRDDAWIPIQKSKLQKEYRKSYYKTNSKYPHVKISHGGLECSVFAKRISNLDMISIGSIIEDFHTVNETIYISSCEKTLKTIIGFLNKSEEK